MLLPAKKPLIRGKRSAVGRRPKQVLLKEERIARATDEWLKRRGNKTDFSDLMHALLAAWLWPGRYRLAYGQQFNRQLR